MKLLVMENLNWIVIILFERTEHLGRWCNSLCKKKDISFLVLDSNKYLEGI